MSTAPSRLPRVDTPAALARYLRSWLKDGYTPSHAVDCAVIAVRDRGNEGTQKRVADLKAKLSATWVTSLRISERITWEFIWALETEAQAEKEA